ncbi:MAG: hypothetical protein Q4F07_07605 [Bacteroidales bacterium]|nr:hypothetical protein [Bacteroidales bacterium]
MLAKRKSDGKVIEVIEWRGNSDVYYSEPNKTKFYQASDLDFDVEDLDTDLDRCLSKSEDVTIEGWVTRSLDSKLRFYTTYPTTAINFYNLPNDLFPKVEYLGDPLPVTLTIKAKKK